MADRNKFEEMLERLINEDKEGAEELFHEIVVEKSRSIYESLLEDDLSDEEVDEATDEEVDESDDEEVDEASEEDDDEEDLEEEFDLDEFEVEGEDDMDPAGDMMSDVEMGEPEMDMDGMDMDDEGGEGDVEDRVEDLEDALDELKAEFEKLMAGDDEGGDDEGGDDMGDMDMDDEGDDEEEAEEAYNFESQDEDDDEEVEEGSYKKKDKKDAPKSDAEQMREYVEKVGGDQYQAFGKMGDNGANTKSAVAGKNDMGGTASNLVRGDTANDPEAGAGKKVSGSALNDQNPKEDNAGNVNVPGGKAGKSNKPMTKGHGAEKKGAGETAANKKSIIGSR